MWLGRFAANLIIYGCVYGISREGFGIRYTYLHFAVFFTVLFLICCGLLAGRFLEGYRVKTRLTALQSVEETASPQIGKPLLQPDKVLPDIFVTDPADVSGGNMRFPAVPPGEGTAALLPRTDQILPRYRASFAQNSDLCGWLEIADTLLSLPVMHTPGDGEYYLHRLFDKSESVYGTPFLDARCSLYPRSGNLIVHGHHMRDGTMFATLSNYEDEAFYKAHPLIRFDTLYQEETYEIIAVFLSVYDETDVSPDLYYNFISAKEEADFNRFLADIQKRALYDTGKTASYGDALLTLITCSYHTDNGRMNVVARRMNTPG